jgi:Flp pilus assembly protein TadG
MRTRSRFTRSRRGISTVEAAFVISMVLLVLFGIMEYGRYLMVLQVANNAAREGARYAVVHTGDGTLKSDVINVVNTRMATVQAQLTGYNADVFTVDPSGVYNTGTNPWTAKYPPTIQQKAGSNWNDASFGGGIAVQITGTYTPLLPSFLFMNASMPVTVTAMMGSEAN